MADSTGVSQGVITIKKYANRRLYNTASSSYVTLEHLARMVKEGVDFVVRDAKTHDDLTRQVLTQIIIEEENKGENLLPVKFLRQIIGLYGHGMQTLVPRYLDLSMESFARNQLQIRQYMEETFTGLFPFGDTPSGSGKRAVTTFEDAVNVLTPLQQPHDAGGAAESRESGARKSSESSDMRDLRAKLDALQEQLDRLLKNSASDTNKTSGG